MGKALNIAVAKSIENSNGTTWPSSREIVPLGLTDFRFRVGVDISNGAEEADTHITNANLFIDWCIIMQIQNHIDTWINKYWYRGDGGGGEREITHTSSGFSQIQARKGCCDIGFQVWSRVQFGLNFIIRTCADIHPPRGRVILEHHITQGRSNGSEFNRKLNKLHSGGRQ
jgi:hypothetical protein